MLTHAESLANDAMSLSSQEQVEIAVATEQLLFQKLLSCDTVVLSDRSDKLVKLHTDSDGSAVVSRTYPVLWLPDSPTMSIMHMTLPDALRTMSDGVYKCGLLPSKPLVTSSNGLDALVLIPAIKALGPLEVAALEIKYRFIASLAQFVEHPINGSEVYAHDLVLSAANFVSGRCGDDFGIYMVDIDPEFSEVPETTHTYARVFALLLTTAEGLSNKEKYRLCHGYLQNLNTKDNLSQQKLDFLLALDLLRNGLDPLNTVTGKLATTYQRLDRA